MTVSGDARLPAGGIAVRRHARGREGGAGPGRFQHLAAKATVNLAKPITNGLTYNFTFNFEKAGQATVRGADLGRAGAPQQNQAG